MIHRTHIWQAASQCHPGNHGKRQAVALALLLTLLITPLARAVVPENPAKWIEDFGELVSCASRTEPNGDSDLWRFTPEDSALGEFSLRCLGESFPVFIQAPHGTTDLKTGGIARQLFSVGNFAALGINGVSRRHGDQAHVDNASFQLSAAAFVNQTGGIVVQLHGFSQSKRQDPNARDANVIISNGTRRASARTRHVAACLGTIFPKVLVYPDDTTELGGTTNTVGQHLRTLGDDNFYHIELSYKTRQRLAQDESHLASLARCLATLYDEPLDPAFQT